MINDYMTKRPSTASEKKPFLVISRKQYNDDNTCIVDMKVHRPPRIIKAIQREVDSLQEKERREVTSKAKIVLGEAKDEY